MFTFSVATVWKLIWYCVMASLTPEHGPIGDCIMEWEMLQIKLLETWNLMLYSKCLSLLYESNTVTLTYPFHKPGLNMKDIFAYCLNLQGLWLSIETITVVSQKLRWWLLYIKFWRQCKSHWICTMILILGESLLTIKAVSNYDVLFDHSHFLFRRLKPGASTLLQPRATTVVTRSLWGSRNSYL